MEQLSKVNFDTLERWALGASLLHGIGAVTRNNRFEPMAMPFYVFTLHTFIQPLCVQTDLEFISPGMRAFSGICLLSAVMIRSSIEKQDELSKTLKSFHAVNEMVTLAAFVTQQWLLSFLQRKEENCASRLQPFKLSAI